MGTSRASKNVIYKAMGKHALVAETEERHSKEKGMPHRKMKKKRGYMMA